MQNTQERMLTLNQVAELLQLSPDTVRKWAREKKLPSIKPSKTVLRFYYSDVVRALRGMGNA